MRPKLTYSNVVSTLCLFLLLAGGAAYAAGQIGKNSVGSKQLKKNAVVTAKIKKEAVTASKVRKGTLTGKQIDLANLGTVPSATTATSLAPLEPIHMVGAAGEPGFENGSTNLGTEGPFTFPSVGFYKDHEGIVHLEGLAKIDVGPNLVSVFTLPPGFRPTGSGISRPFEQGDELVTLISGDGKVMAVEKGVAAFEGITFRAES